MIRRSPSTAGLQVPKPATPAGFVTQEHPRFTCRREGHVPAVTIRNTAGLTGAVNTACLRCGRAVEISYEASA